MTAAETRAFMKRLARYVEVNHLKTEAGSDQRGMVYEYFQVARKGQFDQWIQGEALDTMHDGAWYAAAMVNAFRATGDPYYKRFLAKWQLPFYCKMLNRSDELFTSKRNDARPGAAPWGKVWAFQEGEKGFIPYFWDDGASVSLDRMRGTERRGIRPCVDYLAGRPNPNGRLSGYSLGMSNHMAQDIGVMAQLAWLLLREGDSPADRKLAGELAKAARNLHQCRLRHHGTIPMCAAPAALAARDAELMKRVPAADDERLWTPSNHYTRALRDFKGGKRAPMPGFADDQQYRYYYRIARSAGRLTKALAFKTIYDAYTEPMLYHYYCDDAPVPPGINKFDLYGGGFVNGRPADYRSDRKGPGDRPMPIGSRMGPQNMICCGWALQMLRAYPGIWEQRYKGRFAKDLRVYIRPPGTEKPSPRDATATIGDVSLRIASTHHELLLSGTSRADRLAVELFAGPDATGPRATITATHDKGISAVNDKGEKLTVRGEIRMMNLGTAFDVVLPCTVVKAQRRWANAVEHGRMSLRVAGQTRNVYLASSEKNVQAWLTRELAGGLRTWEAIFDELGFIPTGIGRGGGWDGYSDSGGYAHLISAAAQWLLILQNRTDWQAHNIPAVLDAKPPPDGRHRRPAKSRQ